jgi:hypothetical protein
MRASFAPILALVGTVIISACGSSSGTNSGGSGSGSGSGGASSGGSGGSSGGGSGSSSGSVPLDAAAPDGDVTMTTDASVGTQSFTVQFGPVSVAPGEENTQCIVVPLGNAAAIHVGQIHDLLGTASHHMILYKVASTTPAQTTPVDCQPFQGALNPAAGNPLIISQKPDDTLTLPQNVAFTLDPNQMVRLEMHYINANPTQTVTLVTTSTLTTIPDADYKYDASFLFIGDPEISIPAQSTFNTGSQYFALPAQYNSSNFFAITGHEHHLGTEVQIWSATGASDPGSLIYTSTSWSDPPVTTFSPPVRIPAGGGFKFQCNWDNTTTAAVKFGESANDEMCFFWAYYWPSQGAAVCFTANGASACCPGASPLCTAF